MFLYEHVTGGGLIGQPLPRSLLAEARLMRDALVRDLTAVADVQVHTLQDPRVRSCPRAHTVRVSSAADLEPQLATLASACDVTWVVAPETRGTLERLTRLARDAGARLLGSAPEAIAVAASKRRTAARLAAAGIAVVPELDPAGIPRRGTGHWIVKPDDGCGAEGVRAFRRADALHRHVARHPSPGTLVVQPFLAGTPASLSVIAHDGHVRLLTVNRQHLTGRRGRLRLEGITVAAMPDDDGALQALAGRVVHAIPGLQGYVGIDLVLAPHGAVVVEVNPRVTTSWCGLAAALPCNPAALVLDVAGNKASPPATAGPARHAVPIVIPGAGRRG